MRLPEYLKEQGETQVAFARRTGIPQSTLNLICHGKGTGVETAVTIIKATGGIVSIEDLLPKDREGAAA